MESCIWQDCTLATNLIEEVVLLELGANRGEIRVLDVCGAKGIPRNSPNRLCTRCAAETSHICLHSSRKWRAVHQVFLPTPQDANQLLVARLKTKAYKMTGLLFLFALLLISRPGFCWDAISCQTPIQTNAYVDLGYEIHQGWLNTTGNFYNFSNIPYAAPPVGNLRFSAPVPPPRPAIKPLNNGSRLAVCPQGVPAWTSVTTEWFTNGWESVNQSEGYQIPNITTMPPGLPGTPPTSEDCLLLDVLVPKHIFDQNGFKKPAAVLVWIHGGGYTFEWKTRYGSGAGLVASSLRNGKEGVIYVALNYRLGLFGFLSGPTFQINGTANAGLLDQRFALEWVQQNIWKFGGDPNRVTVIGESAGGGSTIHQITAYGGLKGPVPFQQAISQSGAFLTVPTNQRQENIFQKFLSLGGVDTLQEARGLSTEKLQLVNAILIGEAPYGDFTFNPAVDGSFAPQLPGELLLHGQYDQSLKVLVSHNDDEGLGFISPFIANETTFKQNVILVSFPDADTNNATGYISDVLYPPIFDGSQNYTDQIGRADAIVSEALFACNANYLARAFGNNAYSYRFSVPPALHGDDISYTFYEGPATSVQNDTLALIMQDYITNFAINGDPNGPNLTTFPAYGTAQKVLDLNLTTIGVLDDNLANERCYWWQKALYF